MEIQMGGGSLNLEILRGGGLKQFWISRWMGGSKNCAFRRGGVDFFWNNPLHEASCCFTHVCFKWRTSVYAWERVTNKFLKKAFNWQ